jgi:hypothetical protein
MIKNIAFFTLITLRVFYHPTEAKAYTVPFPGQASIPSAISTAPTKVISLQGTISNNKVILEWVVSENENAEQFEVEKSTDGKNFTMAALVFSSEKTAIDNYQFYEKATKKKTIYRIKIIYKNNTTEYSPVIEIKPNA